ITRQWFESRLGEPTEIQKRAWPLLRRSGHALISAPTGSGKTLAAFLSIIDKLFQEGLNEAASNASLNGARSGNPERHARILYISPLKALSNDVEKNLSIPLSEIREAMIRAGQHPPEITAMVRTGDTSPADR